MSLGDNIYNIRTEHNYSQEQFASIFDVSRQSVQKWEAGTSMPDINNIIKISKHFDVSIDSLLLNDNVRTDELFQLSKKIKHNYDNMHSWDLYCCNLKTEFEQSRDEGKDIDQYINLFNVVDSLPQTEIKSRLADILFEIVLNAPIKKDFKYLEPSTLSEIKLLRKPYVVSGDVPELKELKNKVHGAWLGRICGCMLGKSIEGIFTDELVPFLKETNNYPMHKYIMRSDLSNDIINKYNFRFTNRVYADEINGMPIDDDTNYTLLSQIIIKVYGKDFKPIDVANAWITYQSKNAYCTAERVAFCNFIKGYYPPESAIFQNPFREWIGAQIRADYFGYINPGNPEMAAEMAFRDASISHVKNGIYGEMFVAAMLACAAKTQNHEDIVLGGLAEIPSTSRLYKSILDVLSFYKSGRSASECFKMIHENFNEHTSDWCDTIPNAMIVVASLLYGAGDYTKTICMAVETGFDTDCNGATVGSVFGMAHGVDSIGEAWTKPINNTLETSIFGMDKVKITDCVDATMKHIAMQ